MLRKIFLAVSLVLALTPFVLFPVCDTLTPEGAHMGCWYSGILITVMGALIFILSLQKKQNSITFLLSMCAALSCWLIPNRIIHLQPFGLCANELHACRASTMPTVGITVVVLVALGVTGLVINFVRKDN